MKLSLCLLEKWLGYRATGLTRSVASVGLKSDANKLGTARPPRRLGHFG